MLDAMTFSYMSPRRAFECRCANVPLRTYRRCGNFSTAANCNWPLDGDESAHQTLCKGCRLVRTIPDVSLADGAGLWAKTEVAKQAVVAQHGRA